MKTRHVAFITALFALSLPAMAYAESPTKVPGSTGTDSSGNPGALEAPEKNKSQMAPATGGNAADTGAANVPGTSTESNKSEQNAGSLSSPEKNSMQGAPSTGEGMTKDSSVDVPGSSAGGNSSAENPGALSAPEKK
jgi:hypothetical protein